MHIQPAALTHCREIAQVHVLSWQHAYREILPAEYLSSLSVDGREAVWRQAVVNEAPQLLVAMSVDQVAGFVAFGPSRDKGAHPGCAEIWALYLAPAHWSQGTGRALWLAARQRLFAQGFTSITLWVLARNERARRFYAAAGFTPELASTREFMLGGTRLSELRYTTICFDP